MSYNPAPGTGNSVYALEYTFPENNKTECTQQLRICNGKVDIALWFWFYTACFYAVIWVVSAVLYTRAIRDMCFRAGENNILKGLAVLDYDDQLDEILKRCEERDIFHPDLVEDKDIAASDLK